jgi:hypothetical protein
MAGQPNYLDDLVTNPKSPSHQNRVFSIHLDHIQASLLHRLRCHLASQQTSPVLLSPFVVSSDPRMTVISLGVGDAESGLKQFGQGL